MNSVKKNLPPKGEGMSADQQHVQSELNMKISSAASIIPFERLALAKKAYTSRHVVFLHTLHNAGWRHRSPARGRRHGPRREREPPPPPEWAPSRPWARVQASNTWLMRDAGADPVLDLTDAGLVSTYLVGHRPDHREHDHFDRASVRRPGRCHRPRSSRRNLPGRDRKRVSSPYFCSTVDSVLFAAADAMSAAVGVAVAEAASIAGARADGCSHAVPSCN